MTCTKDAIEQNTSPGHFERDLALVHDFALVDCDGHPIYTPLHVENFRTAR